MSLDFIDPWPDVDERHKVRIYHSQIGGVTGLLPEQFNQSWSNQFSAPFAEVLRSFNQGLMATQELLGKKDEIDFTAVFKELSTQIWAGGSPISTVLRLRYLSRRGATVDVMEPIKRLAEMSSPGVGAKVTKGVWGRTFSGTLLNPPDAVWMELGYVLVLKAALIKSVSVDWSHIVDSEGVPTRADVQMQIESKRAFLGGDDEEVLMGVGGSELVF